jgi:PAT family beta-lactamase induction signal transducer AmpG
MAAAYQWGYRLAIVVAGAAPLLLADAYSWAVSYTAMASLMAVGVAAALLAPREAPRAFRPTVTPDEDGRARPFLTRAFADPLLDFWRRFGRTALLILALICLYRLSDFVLNIMNPFYLDLGFDKTQIAEVRKVFGVVASMTGVFLGGWSIARYGLFGPMVVGAFAGPVSNLVYVWLAARGADVGALFVAIGTDNIASGFAGTCLIAYMSSLTSAGFTATQYALFSSLYSLPGKLIASQSGRIVQDAALNAQAGGFAAPLKSLIGDPSASLAAAAARLGVAPQALGAGYIGFFLYSFAIGLIAIGLAWMVRKRA